MSGYQYDPRRGMIGWSLPQQVIPQAIPQTSTVNVAGTSPVVSTTPVYQALGNTQAPFNYGANSGSMYPLFNNIPSTLPGNVAQGVPATMGQSAQNSLQSALGQANQTALANNARPEFWSMEGALGSTNGNYSGWLGSAINGATALGNLYFGYQGLKLAKKELAERTALQRANFRNQARAMNSAYRDQASGRGYNGMNQEAKSALGQQYANRRVSETY